MVTALQKASREITRYFEAAPQRVYSRGELRSIYLRYRLDGKVPAHITADKFVDFLLRETKFKRVLLRSLNYSALERFAWGEVSPYLLALSINRGSYLTHATAIFLHSLTDQIPRTVYVNREQSPKPKQEGALTQEALNRAFSNKQRRSNYVFQYEGWKFVRVNGKYTNNLGVVSLRDREGETLPVTGLERTLIDIAVRPDYAGGVFQVLEAYRAAKAKMSVNILMAFLKKLDYVYPFHQVIGFYMKKAGYEREQCERFKRLPQEFDFYLAHNIREKEYDTEWRLFVPKGLE